MRGVRRGGEGLPAGFDVKISPFAGRATREIVGPAPPPPPPAPKEQGPSTALLLGGAVGFLILAGTITWAIHKHKSKSKRRRRG